MCESFSRDLYISFESILLKFLNLQIANEIKNFSFSKF